MPPPGAPSTSMPLPTTPIHERRLPSPPHTVEAAVGGSEISMDISMNDYFVGGVAMFDAHTGRGPAGEFFLLFFLFCVKSGFPM